MATSSGRALAKGLDITETNRAVRALIEVTENPRHRYLLEAYDRHRNLEHAGRFEEIFAPEMMQGYLSPDKSFGDVCDKDWDPQVMDPAVFSLDDIFCLIGTDPADYGWASRTAM